MLVMMLGVVVVVGRHESWRHLMTSVNVNVLLTTVRLEWTVPSPISSSEFPLPCS